MATVILLRRAQLLITRSTCASHKITRAMSSMLIDDPKYSWLKDLGLGATNNGAFYGVWGGSGEVTFSIALFTNVNRQCGVLKCHCFLNTIYEHFQSNLHNLKNKFQFKFIYHYGWKLFLLTFCNVKERCVQMSNFDWLLRDPIKSAVMLFFRR